MRTKEQIIAEIGPLRDELDKIERAEKRDEHKKLLGRCFKYRNNYGSGCPGWWLYGKVYALGDYAPICFTFQETAHDIIEIKPREKHGHVGRDGSSWKEISAKEFNAAWRKLQRRIAKAKF